MTHQNTNKLLGNKSLSYKIIAAIMLGMGLLVTLMIVVFGYSFSVLEHDLMQTHSYAELKRIRQQLQKDPEFPLPQTAKLTVYKASDDKSHIPKFLTRLPDDFSAELTHQGKDYFVLISRIGEETIYIADDISEFETSERAFGTVILVTWIIIIAFIFVLSFLLSHYLLKPISDFADEFEELRPEQRGHRFSGKYHGLEVEKIARSADHYLDKLDEYVERQHSFAAMASHELRTPLTIIQTSTELIGTQTKNPSIANQCRKIGRSITKMNDMVLALLSIVRDQTLDQLEDKEIMLFYAAKDAIQNQQQEISSSEVTVTNMVPVESRIRCNPVLLSVVVNNLLTNAIKHCPQGTIDLEFGNHQLSITDTGQGLGTEDTDILFKKGVAGKNNGGYGLGLYIAQLICDRLGWKLSLQNASPGTRAIVDFG